MTTRKALVVLLLCSCLALLSVLIGCDQSDTTKSAKAGKSPLSVADAQKALDTARSRLVPAEQLERVNDESTEARREAERLKAKWQTLRDKTLNDKRNPKNPDDPAQAPKTFAAKSEYDNAQARANTKFQEFTELSNQQKQARREVQEAESALEDAKAQPSPSRGEADEQTTKPGGAQPQGQGESLLAGVAVWLPTGLSVLCLGLLGFFFLRLRTVEGNILHYLGQNSRDIKDVADRLQKLSATASVLNDGPNSLSNLMRELSGLKQRIHRDGQERDKESRYAAAARESDNLAYYGLSQPEALPAHQEVEFPISVETFLSRISGQQRVAVTLDPLKGILVRDPEGLLMLVRDGSVYGGELCMVPNMTRLNTAQEFHYNYERFYECGRPSAGEVWIRRPALVDRVEGGWKIAEKGQLEVRS